MQIKYEVKEKRLIVSPVHEPHVRILLCPPPLPPPPTDLRSPILGLEKPSSLRPLQPRSLYLSHVPDVLNIEANRACC